jgi:NAD-dependent dihydropyrimidine dehydrogenase PreA subunit/flavodoxin
MRITVFYFSGTGNTKWAVNEFKDIISEKGHECRIYSVDTEIINLEEIINEADTIGFVFPIYGCNMPNIMKRYINQFKNILNINCKKPAFIFTTGGYIDGFGPFSANKILKSNGFNLIGYINLKMSNNISTPKIKASFLESKEMKIRMDKGKEEIEKLINRVIDKKRYIRNIGFYLIPGIAIRKATTNAQKNNYLSLSINQEKCSQCMLCVTNCPTKSIVFSGKEFKFLPSCTACMRCYNFCPEYAIYHEGKYADPSIYRRYRGPQSIL